MKKPISEASYGEILTFAQVALQLDVKSGTGTAKIISMMRDVGYDSEDIDVEDDSEAASENPGADAPAGLSYRDDPKVEIEIASDEGEGGDRAVPVSVNGDLILIARDERVKIPYRHFEALEAAITAELRPVEKPDGGFAIKRSNVRTVRYMVHDRPSAQTVQAWRERTATINAAAKAKVIKRKREKALA